MELQVETKVPLALYTTLRVGGVAKYFVVVKSEVALQQARSFVKQAAVPFCVLGGGSNVLIADGELNKVFIKNEIPGISFESRAQDIVFVTAGAGESWDGLVEETVARGFSGLENLSGIPGTVGAAPVQNINAYGASVSDSIVAVRVYDMNTDSFCTLSAVECRFGYRDSIFKQEEGKHLIVVSVTFTVTKNSLVNLGYRSASQSIERLLLEKNCIAPTVADVRQAVLTVRGNIGMLCGEFCSAGSFFKNTVVSAETFSLIEKIVKSKFSKTSDRLSPWHWSLPTGEEKIATAFLLECSPYNKNTYGNKRWNGVVGISPKHSLSIITFAGATTTDVCSFVQEIKQTIKNIFSVTLETEVDFIF